VTLLIDEDRLSETFAALASPTRRAILARLADGEANVNELAGPFNLTLPAISKHIKVLERAGLVTRGQRAQYRPCTLDPAPLAEVSAWAGPSALTSSRTRAPQRRILAHWPRTSPSH
jgi:DNA-binding transcriptional ArsR family regulator